MTKQYIETVFAKIDKALQSEQWDDIQFENGINELISLVIELGRDNNPVYKMDIDVAVKMLEKILEFKEEDDLLYLYTKAFISYVKGNYDKYFADMDYYIETYIKEFGYIDCETAQLIFLDVIYYVNQDDDSISYEKCLKKLHAILNKHCPDTAFEHWVKYLLSETSNTNILEKYLYAILEKDNKWSAAYYELGDINYQKQKWKEAAYNYEKAMALSDLYKTDSLYFYLAWTYSKLKDYEKEEHFYRKCLEITPAYPYANNNLGYCLYKLTRYQEALVYYDKSIELGIDKHYPYRNKYDVLKKLGKTMEAVELIKTSSEYFKTKYYRNELMKYGDGNIDLTTIMEKLKGYAESEYAGEMKVANVASGIELYPHQEDAIKAMDKTIPNTNEYAGLLVLPTGGGKTLTAAYWLMRSLLDRGYKVIWLAHRHELLDQARRSFEYVCYSDVVKNKESYHWRIISGQHDKPIHIKPTDDIIIASKTSLKRGINYFIHNWLKENKEKVFLIIDEAHHAAASEYRSLIDTVRTNTKGFKMLGLTATPFRMADQEQGMLKKIFPDDIVYKIDLRELINRGILSEPIFKSIPTDVNMSELFRESDSEEALDRIINENFFDIDSIGTETAKAIATNSKRNNAIVKEYVKKRHIYKQTLVFALNVEMAIALNGLFKDSGIRSDFIVSDVKDEVTKVTISSEENKIKLQKFRDGELDVLVNVNILTEGTDLPCVQSVFLTRPTKSTILMTQMIGRALRGEKAGGTKDAYIVSFIDDWQDKIAWVNPEQLFIDENVDFTNADHHTQEKAMRLVSIAKIEEFAKMANDTVDTKLTELSFIERIPIGIIKFSYLIQSEDEEEADKSCNILVYDFMEKAFDELFAWLPTADLTDAEIAADHVDMTLFGELDSLLGYNKQDVADIIEYYKQTQEIPQMIYLSERKHYDVSVLARHICDNKLNMDEEVEYIKNEWSRNDKHWSAFFGIENQKIFRKLINDAKDRIKYPEDYSKPKDKPITEKEKIQIQQLPLYEIRRRYPALGEKIRRIVFERFTDEEGFYYSAQSGFRSKNKLDFQIDHIMPMSQGGLTVPDNLQLLSRVENMNKSDKLP